MKYNFFTEPTEDLIPTVFGLAKIARISFDGGDMGPLWQQLTGRLSEPGLDTTSVLRQYAALMDMCLIDQILDNTERGLAFQSQALQGCRLYQLPAKAAGPKLKLLGFAAPGKINANTPIEFLIEDTDIALTTLYIVPGQPLPPVPDHDIAIVLAADSEENRPVLREIEDLVNNWPRPVINHPSRIPLTGRESLYQVLSPLSGVDIPATARADRAALQGVADGVVRLESLIPDGGFPAIIRPLDSHAGFGLEKVSSAADVAGYLTRHSELDFFVSRFVDYKSAGNGKFRKYRITIIDGIGFPCHMGISDHWMIHFVNAGMLESAEKRAEEQRFMDEYQVDFGRRHGPACAEIARALDLDYIGIDCAETADGKLLIFEAGTALVAHNMDHPEIFPYKGPHMRAIFDAFRDLLSRKIEEAGLSKAA